MWPEADLSATGKFHQDIVVTLSNAVIFGPIILPFLSSFVVHGNSSDNNTVYRPARGGGAPDPWPA